MRDHFKQRKRAQGRPMSDDKPVVSDANPFPAKPFIVVGALGMVATIGFFAFIMYGMAANMARMTDYVGTMTRNVESMATDVHAMHQTMGRMDVSIREMDVSIDEMNKDMAEIEAVMAEDLDSMRQVMEGMGGDVRNMSFHVTGMNAQMGQMTYDINRGRRTFSTPMGYMNNIMTPQ